MKASFLSDYMLNQSADEALTGADTKVWQRPCENSVLLIHYFPTSRGYLEKAEKMKIFHLSKFLTPLPLKSVQLF